MKLGQVSPYGKGLGRIAPPGMQPRGMRIDRWQGWTSGTADREVSIPAQSNDQGEHDSQDNRLNNQAQRYIRNWVDAMYQDEDV